MSVISVIVAVYNVESYIDKCIESICKQSYSDLQIILVDDGSEDDSGRICDRWKDSDNRVEVIHQKNMGLVKARKAGLKRAKSEFIAFVDGDDYLESNMYEIMLHRQQEIHADVVNAGFLKENAEVNICHGIFDIKKDEALNNAIKYIFDLKSPTRIFPSIWSKLFRADYIKNIYAKIPDDCSYGEDLLALLYMMGTDTKICSLNEALYHYVQRSGSIVNEANRLYYLKKLPAINQIKRVVDVYRGDEKVPDVIDIFLKNELLQGLRKSFEDVFAVSQYRITDIERLVNKRILLYGSGDVGKDFYAQLKREGSCASVIWADASRKMIGKTVVEKIDNIRDEQFDVLIIAVNDEEVAETIRRRLLSRGVSEKKMIWDKPAAVR